MARGPLDAPAGESDAGDAHAKYVFTVRFRLDPEPAGVSVDPHTFETTLYRRADPPGESGWRFFRDNLWHGEVNDPAHLRELTAEALGVDVVAVEFEELRTGPDYLDDLRVAIGEDLDAFRAETVEEVLSKYLGSSIRVVEPAEDT